MICDMCAFLCVCLKYVCVCVCVCERERETQREIVRERELVAFPANVFSYV